MSTDKPTQEQIREFWEWCGWKRYKRQAGSIETWLVTGTYWASPEAPDVFCYADPPDLDLNNLFKYAIPAVNRRMDRHFQLTQVTDGWKCDIGLGDYTYTNKDPALALFWAIWEAKV